MFVELTEQNIIYSINLCSVHRLNNDISTYYITRDREKERRQL